MIRLNLVRSYIFLAVFHAYAAICTRVEIIKGRLATTAAA